MRVAFGHFGQISEWSAVSEWEGEVLEITRISRLDMSAYLCIASNGVPPSVSKKISVSVDCEYCMLMTYLATFQNKLHRIESNVFSVGAEVCLHHIFFYFNAHFSSCIRFLRLVPPMVWIPQQLVGTPVGYNVTLECFIEAYPISLNYWSKDDSDMIHDSNKYK